MASLDVEMIRLARTNRGPYLAALCAPRHVRAQMLALIAFDAEMARVPKLVSEPTLGRIRLQWWIDVLPDICRGHPPSHPIARALASLNLPVVSLCALVEAHQLDLQYKAVSPAQKAAYAEATGGALHVLMLDMLEWKGDGVDDPHRVDAQRDIGTAWVLSGMRNKGVPDEAARAQAFDILARARRVPVARPSVALARLTSRRLKNPNDPLGIGALMSVWWGGMTGRL